MRDHRYETRLGVRYAVPSRSRIHDFFCGAHSGVKRCCIEFFVNVWIPGLGAWLRGQRSVVEEHRKRMDEKDFRGMIPCPTCLETAAVSTHVELTRCRCRFWHPRFMSRMELPMNLPTVHLKGKS